MRRYRRVRVHGKPAKLVCAELRYGAPPIVAPSAGKPDHEPLEPAPDMSWQRSTPRVAD